MQPSLPGTGGGGINVARALIKLGGRATAIFPSGGYTGKYLNYLMEKENVPSVIIETTHETRENFVVLDESGNKQYRFGMPGTELKEKEWRLCLDAVEAVKDATFIVASGSLPPGVPPDIYARLARIVQNNNAKLIVDTSGEALEHAAGEGSIYLNLIWEKLASLAGRKAITRSEAPAIAQSVIEEGKCEVMIVSMGAAGALLVTGNLSEMIVPPPVKQKSTVGAGDSMVAGIIFYLSKGKSLPEAARYGVACGTAATLNAGTQLCRKEDVDKIYAVIQQHNPGSKILF
jgi:6-phosphofructokinase 2